MVADPQVAGAERHYRRGAVMGLTVAEAFMLIAFALLMLFALWQKETQGQLEAATEIVALLDDKKEAVFAASEDGSLDQLLRLKEQGFDMAGLLRSPMLIETEKLSRMIDQETLSRLSDAILKLPENQRREIVDLITLEGLAGNVAEVAAIAELIEGGATLDRIREALTATEAMGPDAAKDMEAIAELRAQGHDPSQLLEEVEAQKTRIRGMLANEGDKQQQLANALDDELGDLVRGMGGHIDERGRIIIPNPDGVLFAAGSAEITPGLRDFLARACGPWLTTLRDSSLDVSEIRIEGHASSEWTGALSQEDAFLRNLGLSQARAQAVLGACLDLVGVGAVRDWARGYMTAVGYSSARPVISNGQEDAPRSRRVVFNAEISHEGLIEEIGREVDVSAASTGPLPSEAMADMPVADLTGTPSVTDADTIRFGDTRVRLFGIDAPEMNQTCTKDDGSGWSCGRDAAEALRQRIGAGEVICEMRDIDRYGRIVAVCKMAGDDLGAWLVDQGLAVAYRQYSNDYVDVEAQAKVAGRGLWAGDFEMPWDVRRN